MFRLLEAIRRRRKVRRLERLIAEYERLDWDHYAHLARAELAKIMGDRLGPSA